MIANAEAERFIPAPAGNTAIVTGIDLRYSVHPRACGEHNMDTTQRTHTNGSSPRLRGTHLRPCPHAKFVRFIPAPAGNTGAAARRKTSHPVHPRACGEHAQQGYDRVANDGSSPRLRGTPMVLSINSRKTRFIPAPAGNTSRKRSPDFPRAVHPRACGEHMKTSRLITLETGSSPRLRGTQ